MADRFRIPPRFDLKSRPFKGLTIRQILFLAFFGSAALLCLMTPLLGQRLWGRALAAFCLLTVGLVLAFLSPGGMSLTSWGHTLARYFARARLRVWWRTATPQAQPLEEILPPTPLMPFPAPIPERLLPSPLGILFDVVLLFILYLATWYMARGGGYELALYWNMLTRG